MAIPRYDDMFAALLLLMEDGAPREKSSLILPLAKRLNVSKEDQTETLRNPRRFHLCRPP